LAKIAAALKPTAGLLLPVFPFQITIVKMELTLLKKTMKIQLPIH
jgi:hypothetical protein